MKCQKCKNNFEEKDIEDSHDVPCYLFDGNRKVRKNQADKFGRHWLCKKCHKEYELLLQLFLRTEALRFSKIQFEGDYYG